MKGKASMGFWQILANGTKRIPLWYLGACCCLNFMLLLATVPPGCNHQNVVDAGAGAGGMISTGGTPATGGNMPTGGAPGATGGAPGATGGTSTSSSSSTDACDVAGAKLSALHCTQQTTPKGVPFATACKQAHKSGLNWHPECIAKATACSQVPALYRGCP